MSLTLGVVIVVLYGVLLISVIKMLREPEE